MGLIPLYDAAGNPLKDSGGNIIYLSYDGPNPARTVVVAPEPRVIVVRAE